MKRGISPEALARARAVAARQHLVITSAQAGAAGLSPPSRRQLLERGDWRPLLHGAYLIGAAPAGPEQFLAAAVALTGGTASHLSAAWLLDLTDAPPGQPHVTVSVRAQRKVTGVVAHRSHRPPARIVVRGFPCTDATRALVDVAPLVPRRALTDMLDRALALRLTALPRLEHALTTAERHRRGAARLRAQLDAWDNCPYPPSVLERRAARLFERSGLRHPAVQVQVTAEGGRYRLDFAYRDVKLAIEVKGYRWHSSPEQLAADDRRQNDLVAGGWLVLSFDWDAVVHHPGEVVAVVRRTLARLGVNPASRPA